jgi:class 3 adenylate cyclase
MSQQHGTIAVREERDPLHAVKTVGFAKAMLREAAKVVLPTSGEPVKIRVGLHSGWVGAGGGIRRAWPVGLWAGDAPTPKSELHPSL